MLIAFVCAPEPPYGVSHVSRQPRPPNYARRRRSPPAAARAAAAAAAAPYAMGGKPMDADGGAGGDGEFPSFTDAIPAVLQQTILEHLTWADTGGAAGTCKAWNEHFNAQDTMPSW